MCARNKNSLILCLILLSWFAFLFWQNTLISNSFANLSLREVDDLAFQVTLRNIHNGIHSNSWHSFWAARDYGYGWLFWAIHALLTYPFYLLGSESAIIIAAREISLVFATAGVWVSWLCVKRLTGCEAGRFIVVSVLLTCPILIGCALRFHTHMQVFFFSAEALYFVLIANGNDSRLRKAAMFAGCAAGSKLIGLFILPTLGLIYLSQIYQNELSTREKLNQLLVPFLYFTIAFIFAWYPLLFLAPYFRSDIDLFVYTTKFYIKRNATNLGGPENEHSANILKNVLFTSYFSWPVWSGLLASVGLGIKSKSKSGNILILCLIGLIIPLGYLFFRSKAGPWETSTYLIPLLPVVICLSAGLIRSGRLGQIALGSIVLINILLNSESLLGHSLRYQRQLNSVDFKFKESQAKSFLQFIPETKKDRKIRILKDYRLILPVSELSAGYELIALYDNFQEFQGAFDVVFLSKEGPLFFEASELDKRLGEAARMSLLKSKEYFDELMKSGSLYGYKFNLVLDSESVLVFKRSTLNGR
jgi:hypothetical protein